MLETTKYRVMIDSHKYKNKDKAKDYTGKIKTSIIHYPKHVPLTYIVKRLEQGHTIVLSELKITDELLSVIKKEGKTKPTARKEAWVSQQLFGIDIDNKYSVKDPSGNGKKIDVKHTGHLYLEKNDILQLCTTKGLKPCLIYETLSSTKEHKKYRVIFAMDRLITSFTERTQIAKALIELFYVDNYCLADPACTDAARLFYPANNFVYKDYESVNPVDFLLMVPLTYDSKKAKNKSTTSSQKEKAAHIAELICLNKNGSYQEQNEMVERIKNQDWLTIKNVVKKRIESVPNPCGSKSLEDTTTRQTIITSYINNIRTLFGFWSEASTPVVPTSRQEFYARIQQIPLNLLFDLPEGTFNCILPGHEDKNPSAVIINDNDKSIYYCHSCSAPHAYNVFDLMSIYLPDLSRTFLRKKISYVFNIQETTKWQQEQARLLMDIDLYMDEPDDNSIGSFQQDSPYLYKMMNNSGLYVFVQTLYRQAAIHVLDKSYTKDEKPVYIAELNRISRIIKDKYKGFVAHSKSTMHKNLHIAALLGIVEFVQDDQNNPLTKIGELRRMEHNQRIEQKLKNAEKLDPMYDVLFQYRANVIRLNYLNTPDVYLEAERRYKKLKEIRFPFGRAHEREPFKWGMQQIGVSVDDHFVQDKEKNAKSELDVQLYKKFKSASKSLLKKQGYFTRDELLNHRILKEFRFNDKKVSYKQKKESLAIVTPELLQELSIKNTVYSSYYKELYQINQAKADKIKRGTRIYIPAKDYKGK